LAARFLGTDLVGVLRAKTGSLTSVLALAGVVEDSDPPLTFAFLVNAEPGTPVPAEAEELQRELAEALARWPEVPGALGPEDPDG
jgi:D-alanyl-D-alanine carboxypeptidase